MIGFSSYCELPLYEQRKLQSNNFSGWRGYDEWSELDEDLTGSVKRKKMIELEKLLKTHDYFYVYSNGPSYRKGKTSQDQIEKLVGEIGKDGLKLYRKYIKQNESVEEKEKKKTKKEKEDEDEIVNVKPKRDLNRQRTI